MRAMIIAGALAAAATSAHAAEPAACYDAAVIGWVSGYANDRIIDDLPVPEDRILPRAQGDMLVNAQRQVAGDRLPKKVFWARAVLTSAPPPSPMILFYLKNEPDGVPSLVGYRLAPPFYRSPELADYPAC